jgi:hypothetical protein
MSSDHYPPIKAGIKTGNEPFFGTDTSFTLLDFWCWEYFDLIGNTERGKLAEFIVAMAMYCTDAVSGGWGTFDVLSPEGIRIEVKTSAYLQSWGQKRLSDIHFGIKESLAWVPETILYAKTASRNSDVIVMKH